MTLRVLLVSSWGNRCGIAEYARLLKESVEGADREIAVIPGAEWLDPASLLERLLWTQEDTRTTLIHLNHHDALHSRWTSDHVRTLTQAGYPVVVTYHDTREQLATCPKLERLAEVASSTIVHEPVEGLNAIYWRQGIPAPAQQPVDYAYCSWGPRYTWIPDPLAHPQVQHPAGKMWKAFPQQPVLGTFGFDFPWKNFLKLAEETKKAGWAYVCLSHDMTDERAEQIRILNPYSLVVREYLDTPTIVNYLAGCDATAFMYECANTGTSGAIRTGIAARKPILAFAGCRQFRDLYELDGWYGTGFHWAINWDDFQKRLLSIWPTPWEPTVTKLAHNDSWAQRGRDHAKLYRMLTQGPQKEL